MSEVRDGLPESKRGTAGSYETSDPRTHYAELDALRGIAIIGVVMTHLASFWFIGTRQQLEVPLLRMNLLSYFNLGYLGVSLFFLLSGYLLTWTEEKRARRSAYSLLSYAKRRALRLIPAYYVAIVLVVVLWPTRPSLGDVALLFTFLHGFRPQFPVGLDPAVWSLTPEVAFYAMLPFLVLKLRSLPQRLAVFGVLATVSVVTRFLMEYGVFESPQLFGGTLADNRMYFYPTTLLYLFIAGMLLRMMVERIETGRIPDGWRHTAALISTVVPVVVLATLPYLVRRQDLLGSPLAFVAEGMMILFFAAALLGSPILKPLLNWRPLASLGKISYSLFLLHMTVIYLTIRYVLSENRSWLAEQSELVTWGVFLAYMIFVLTVATALSYLSYRYVESPFLRQKPK
ncbi:MAG: acyltransferase family protein [Rubrobacteraceae bacterium]